MRVSNSDNRTNFGMKLLPGPNWQKAIARDIIPSSTTVEITNLVKRFDDFGLKNKKAYLDIEKEPIENVFQYVIRCFGDVKQKVISIPCERANTVEDLLENPPIGQLLYEGQKLGNEMLRHEF